MGPIPRLALSLTTATRLLVISPHPDDGALAAAGLMVRTVARGGVVRVVQMTSGDAFSEGVKRVDHTGERLDLIHIERPDLAAGCGTFGEGGIDHVRQLHIDAEKHTRALLRRLEPGEDPFRVPGAPGS